MLVDFDLRWTGMDFLTGGGNIMDLYFGQKRWFKVKTP